MQQISQQCEALQASTFELRPNTSSWSSHSDSKEWQWYKTKTKLYLICSPIVLNKLMTSHSSSDGDKLKSRGARQKGTKLSGGGRVHLTEDHTTQTVRWLHCAGKDVKLLKQINEH